jgi:hypothetical protein
MKSSPPRFFKNISDLNIKIKHDLKTAVEFNPRKKLSRNKYLPIYINIKILITIDYFIRLLKTKLLI